MDNKISDDLIDEYVMMVASRGPTFIGGSFRTCQEIAAEWAELFGDRVELADRYMEAGVWDASTAADLLAADMMPSDLAYLPAMFDGMDTVYALCNNDTTIEKIKAKMEV